MSSITLISPNGGENWSRGSIQKIEWISDAPAGGTIKIELFKAGVFSGTIVSETTDDNLFLWQLSSTSSIIGNDFTVKVTNVTENISDISNNIFTISTPIIIPQIILIQPNGNEIYERGMLCNISWIPVSTGNVKLELINSNNTVAGTIIESALDNGKYVWKLNKTSTSIGTG